MARTGRPPVAGQSVYVRLDPETARALDAYVARENAAGPARVTKNGVIRWALKNFLAALEKTP